jgi:hypothetical protein
MRTLTDRENRIVRFAVVGIVIYLALFYGRTFLEKKRTEYLKLVTEAHGLRQKLKPYEDRALVVKKMMEDFHMDPTQLKKASVVADASAAIQKSAKSGNIQLGPIRESSARSSAKGLTTVQLEGSGPVPAMLAFLNSLNTVGFPVIVDSVQFTADTTRPGQVKMSLTIIILDFEQWKSAEVPHA